MLLPVIEVIPERLGHLTSDVVSVAVIVVVFQILSGQKIDESYGTYMAWHFHYYLLAYLSHSQYSESSETWRFYKHVCLDRKKPDPEFVPLKMFNFCSSIRESSIGFENRKDLYIFFYIRFVPNIKFCNSSKFSCWYFNTNWWWSF